MNTHFIFPVKNCTDKLSVSSGVSSSSLDSVKDPWIINIFFFILFSFLVTRFQNVLFICRRIIKNCCNSGIYAFLIACRYFEPFFSLDVMRFNLIMMILKKLFQMPQKSSAGIKKKS